jgi:hypothetical protein
MAVILRTLFMRDLRGNRVFPRLAYAASTEAADRNIRRLYRFLIRRPINRAHEFLATLRDHKGSIEILLAAFAVAVAFIRALALLLLAAGLFFIVLNRF